MAKKHTPNPCGGILVKDFQILGQKNLKPIEYILKKNVKKNGKFTAQPQYPCFGQDLGDSAGASNLPLQR